jgi:hypothetical protein
VEDEKEGKKLGVMLQTMLLPVGASPQHLGCFAATHKAASAQEIPMQRTSNSSSSRKISIGSERTFLFRGGSSIDTTSSSSELVGFSAEKNVETTVKDSGRMTRDVWVNPSGSDSFRTQDLPPIISDRKDQNTLLKKYLWVSPDRKVQAGKISWPERRSAMMDLQTADDVVAALSRFVLVPNPIPPPPPPPPGPPNQVPSFRNF